MDGMGIIRKGDKAMQHEFVYVEKAKRENVRKELQEIIHKVQNVVRDDFTFQYRFIGSSARNMITFDKKSNVGFDFDVNFYVNDKDEAYAPKEIRRIMRRALDDVARDYGYDYCEDSTRVLTIKKMPHINSGIQYSCDFVIVRDEGGKQQYIRYNKQQGTYTWENQPEEYRNLDKKVEWLRKRSLWNEVRDCYLKKKNCNIDVNKKSRAIYAETVNEMCQKNGYKDR